MAGALDAGAIRLAAHRAAQLEARLQTHSHTHQLLRSCSTPAQGASFRSLEAFSTDDGWHQSAAQRLDLCRPPPRVRDEFPAERFSEVRRTLGMYWRPSTRPLSISTAVSGTHSMQAACTQRLQVVRRRRPPSTGHSAHAGARLGPDHRAQQSLSTSAGNFQYT